MCFLHRSVNGPGGFWGSLSAEGQGPRRGLWGQDTMGNNWRERDPHRQQLEVRFPCLAPFLQ